MLDLRRLPPRLDGISTGIFTMLKDGGLTTADVSETDCMNELVDFVLSGDTALMIDGSDKAIIISSKSWPNRGVPSADTEIVVQGSKEAFSETFRINTVLIRRRIRDANLKVKQLKAGRSSKTDIALMYMNNLVRKDILEEAERRINDIDIDAILDCGYIEQFIEEDWLSPFPQTQVTERPDKAAAAILEGRVVIIVDNSPFVLIIPTTVDTFFQSSEDYYQRFHIMSFLRIIRFASALISVMLPGFYIAVTTFHPSMLPMMLILKMSGARENIPFPAVLEILIMDLAFELLREAEIRLPGASGSAIGIVGGLILGQAAVEAGIVSPVVVIIIALSGISSFAVPHNSLVNALRLSKYMIIILSAVLGLFGFWAAILILVIHLSNLKSFGIPYLYPFVSPDINDYKDLKDSVIRAPLFLMRTLPFFANPKSRDRLRSKNIFRKE